MDFVVNLAVWRRLSWISCKTGDFGLTSCKELRLSYLISLPNGARIPSREQLDL